MVRRQAERKTVYVALSGGVDSAVTAHLLLREGYRVVCVFMRPWQPAGMRCLWEREREDALRVAAHLDVPFLDWDFSQNYARRVADPMVRAYRAGLTPNPDVECNRHIKFDVFAKRALREGADFIATGHYARLVRKRDAYYIALAEDTKKDQTYFLWGVDPAILQYVLFPVGDMQKSRVRAIARRANLPVAQKKDSQGVCFVGALDMKGFLAARIRPRAGEIIHIADGRVLGTHDGAAFYTIGQRHGLNITDGGGPYYVLSRDVKKNRIVVGESRDLLTREAYVRDVRWFERSLQDGDRLQVRIRHQAPLVPARWRRGGRIQFSRPVRAIASGQSAAFYKGSLLLGGGILAEKSILR